MLALSLLIVSSFAQTFTTDIRWGERHSVSWSFATPQKDWNSPATLAVQSTCDGTHTFTPVWTNARTLKVDIEPAVTPDEKCVFELPAVLKAAKSSFEFRAPKAKIISLEPWRFRSGGLFEDDPVQLQIDHVIDPLRLAQHAHLEVQGLEEKVELEPVSGALLKELDKNSYKEETVQSYWFRFRRALPTGKQIKLVVKDDQTQAFEQEGTVREPFLATARCERGTPEAPCSPLGEISVNFNANVNTKELTDIRLVMGKKEYAPAPFEKDQDVATSVRFKTPLLAESTVEVKLNSDIEDVDGRGLANQKKFPVKMKVGEFPPLAKLPGTFGIMESGTEVLLPVAIRNTDRPLKLRFNQTRWGSMSALNLLKWMDAVEKRHYQHWEKDLRSTSVFAGTNQKLTTKELSPKLSTRDLEMIGLPLPGKGLHVVEVESPKLGASLIGEKQNFFVSSLILVTDLAVHWKQGETNALAWVTSLSTGTPVAGAKITVANCMGKELASGATGKDGVALFPKLSEQELKCTNKTLNLYGDVVITAQTKDDFSFVKSTWREGIESWRFDVARSYQASFLGFHTIVDRPLYQPDQTVSGLVLARDFSDQGLIFPVKPMTKRLRIVHSGSEKSWDTSVLWNDLQGAPFTFKLPAESPLGLYNIRLIEKDSKGQDQATTVVGSFEVEAIKVPLMSLKLAWENKKDQFSVARPSMMLGSLHYLSGPPAADQPVTLRGKLSPGYGTTFKNFEDFNFATGNIRMLDESEETISLDNVALKTNKTGALTYRFSKLTKKPYLQNMALEVEYMDPSGLLQSQYLYAKLSPADDIVGIKAPGKLDTKTPYPLSFAVADLAGRPKKGAKVEVEIFRRDWKSVRKKILGGFYSYESGYKNEALGELCEGKTNSQGLLVCNYKFKEGGSYLIQAKTEDDQGQVSTTYVQSYVDGPGDYTPSSEAHDRADLVPDKKEYTVGDEAKLAFKIPFQESWVLLTKERRGILSHSVLKLDRQNNGIKLKVTSTDAPNQFYSALAVRGRVAAAAPTGTIDMGKPSIRLGLTEIKVKRPETKFDVTVSATPQLVQVRDSVTAKIKVARTGGAKLPKVKLAIAVIDAGLLELKPHTSFNLENAFAQSFTHNVDTSTSASLIIGRRHFGLKAKPTGGDGGNKPARELFDTLLYWNPAMTVNAQGEAVISFKANDSLTEFKVLVVAYSESLFGQGQTSFKVTQDLLSFASLSPTLRIGDKTASKFTLQNTTDAALKLEMDYVQLGSSKPIKEKKSLDLPALEAEVVSFPNMELIDTTPLTHNLTIKSQGKTLDKLVVSQKVLPLKAPMVTASDFYEVNKTLELPAPSKTGNEAYVQVYFSPSVLGPKASLDEWMENYPYRCLEQETARLVILRTKAVLLPYMKELTLYQDGNGLLRYYPVASLEGSASLTAHLLEMFHWAKLDKIDAGVRNRAEEALMRVAAGELNVSYFWASKEVNERIKLHALATLYLVKSKHIRPQYAATYTHSPATDTLSDLIDKWIIFTATNRLTERDLVLTDLARRFEVSSAKMELKPRVEDQDFWMLATPTAHFARFLLLAKEIGLSNELSAVFKGQEAKWLRGFAVLRRQGHFGETISNSFAALVHQYYATPSPTGKTLVNAQAHSWPTNHESVKVSGEAMFAPLKLSHQGTGTPYADVQYLSYLDPAKNFAKGFTVSKTLSFLEGKSPKIGQRIRVTYTVTPQQSSTQVAMRLPLPSGVTALQVEVDGPTQPIYQERGFDEVRLYFDQTPSNKPFTISMVVRPNQAGTFAYPGARVEEMYAAQVFGKEADGEMIVE